MKFHDPYTIRTWESLCGRAMIERDIQKVGKYIVKVWGLDPPAFIMGEEIERQLGWQTVDVCDTLEAAQKRAQAVVEGETDAV